MPYNAEKARKHLRAFLSAHKDKLSGRSLCAEAGLSPSAISQFLNRRSEAFNGSTARALADAATQILERTVTIEEMLGEAPPANAEIPVRSYIGAGDEIVILATDDPPLYWVPAPPGMEKAEATEVRGRSMIPLYHEGDLLFHQRIDTDPSRWINEVVAVQVKGGKRFVKLLERGARKGRYKLTSVNPAFLSLEDQQVEWIGPIEWVRKRKRK